MDENQTQGLNPLMVLNKAIEGKVDLDQLQKLMDLYERWQGGIAKKEFIQALSDFQADCPIIEKSSKAEFNGKTQYKYATLGTIIDTIKKVLQQNGLSYRWETEEKDNKISITCILTHIGGYEAKNTMSAVADTSGSKNSIQSYGSSVTYLQRYTLIGSLGIGSADTDDEGSSVKPKEEKKPELTPKHDRWKGANKGIVIGNITMDQVKKNYSLSPANEELLKAKLMLTPKDEDWNRIGVDLELAKTTIEEVKKVYSITPENEKLLCQIPE